MRRPRYSFGVDPDACKSTDQLNVQLLQSKIAVEYECLAIEEAATTINYDLDSLL